ncbi:MAG: elongation factor P [Bacillota bacterium]|nr:elongation factor P [Bacillota bacterium]
MISSNDFYSGAAILVDGEPFQVLQSEHVKPGKGPAFVRAKLRNLKTGATVEKTFNAGEKIPRANVERSEMQFLYADGDQYVFMDNETFEQIGVSKDILGDDVQFLQENMEVKVVRFEGRVVEVELPSAVELTVVETDPGLKGDTASGGSKPAKLEGGAVIQVPLFVRVGDRVRVDTRTREYVSRV